MLNDMWIPFQYWSVTHSFRLVKDLWNNDNFQLFNKDCEEAFQYFFYDEWRRYSTEYQINH